MKEGARCRAPHSASPVGKLTSAINENTDTRKHSGKGASEAEERGTEQDRRYQLSRLEAPAMRQGEPAVSGCCALVPAGPPPWNALRHENLQVLQHSVICEAFSDHPGQRRSLHFHFCPSQSWVCLAHEPCTACPSPAQRGRGTSARCISPLPEIGDLQAEPANEKHRPAAARVEGGRVGVCLPSPLHPGQHSCLKAPMAPALSLSDPCPGL